MTRSPTLIFVVAGVKERNVLPTETVAVAAWPQTATPMFDRIPARMANRNVFMVMSDWLCGRGELAVKSDHGIASR
jgi:hypothetical protein